MSLLDTACARVAISQHATPAEVEDICAAASRRSTTELGHHRPRGGDRRRGGDRQAPAETRSWRRPRRSPTLEARWKRRRRWSPRSSSCAPSARGRAVGRSSGAEARSGRRLRSRGEAAAEAPSGRAPSATTPNRGTICAAARADGRARQAAGRDAADPADGRPAGRRRRGRRTGPASRSGRMVEHEIETGADSWPSTLDRARRRAGSRHGDDRQARADHAAPGLDDPDKPIGVFMLAGPSGVGKTETALALAESALRRRAEPDHRSTCASSRRRTPSRR